MFFFFHDTATTEIYTLSYTTLFRSEEGKAIRVDAVRQLADFMAQTAQQGGRKVVILHPAEAMNLNAANALLKSLEEPTPRPICCWSPISPAACCRPSAAAVRS